MDKTWGYKKHIEIGGTMESVQQELLKKLSNQSSIDEIQNYIKKIMEMRGFNKEKSSDKILLTKFVKDVIIIDVNETRTLATE